MARRKIEYNSNGFYGGVQEYTSPFLDFENKSPYLENVSVRRPGITSKSAGYSELGTSAVGGSKINSLGVRPQLGGFDLVVRHYDTFVDEYNFSTGSWTSITTSAPDVPSSITEIYRQSGAQTYGGYLIAFGTSNNIFKRDSGSGAFVSNVRGTHAAYFKGRAYLGNVSDGTNTYNNRLVWSERLNPSNWDFDTDFIDEPNSPITGLYVYGSKLYVFTLDAVYTYDEYVFGQVPSALGTPSEKSIASTEGRLIWFNNDGVYMLAGESLPILVSKPVQSFIEAVVDPEGVVAGIDKLGRYKLCIGDVTVDGQSLTDVCLNYDVTTNAWTWETDKPFSAMTEYDSSGSRVLYAGKNDDRQVYEIDSGTSNDGSAIASTFTTPYIGIDKPEDRKTFTHLYVTYKPTGASEYISVEYRTEYDATWQQVGDTANNIDMSGSSHISLEELNLNKLSGKFVQFRFTHSSSSAGFEIYNIRLTGYTDDL